MRTTRSAVVGRSGPRTTTNATPSASPSGLQASMIRAEWPELGRLQLTQKLVGLDVAAGVQEQDVRCLYASAVELDRLIGTSAVRIGAPRWWER